MAAGDQGATIVGPAHRRQINCSAFFTAGWFIEPRGCRGTVNGSGQMGVQLRLSASSSLHVTSLNDVFESPQEVGTCDVVGSHAASDSRVLILTVIW